MGDLGSASRTLDKGDARASNLSVETTESLQPPSDVLSDSPAALIRGMEGLIAYWSSAMEDRYGFAAEQAGRAGVAPTA